MRSGLSLKRPLCFAAVVCLLFSVILITKQKSVSPLDEGTVLECRGKVVAKERENSYGKEGWKITLDGCFAEYKKEGSEGKPLQDWDGKKVVCSLKEGENEPRIGQELIVRGRLRLWEEASNPGQFDFGIWYRSKGIVAQLRDAEATEVTGQEGGGAGEYLWQWRQWGVKTLESSLGAEYGGIISAMLLGEKKGLSQEVKGLYQRNGLSHLLSISGLHLMLLGMGLYKVLRRLFCPVAAPISIGGAVIYCWFTGNSVSAVRAMWMFCILILAGCIGRSYDSLSALSLAAILQLISEPWSVLDSGFQLSYLAVVGVSVVVPRLNQIFPVEHKWIKSMYVSVGVGMTTLPVLLYQFGIYPWQSILLNLIVVPLMAPLLWLSFFLLCLAALFSPDTLLCILLSGVIKGILFYYEICCSIGQHVFSWLGYSGRPAWWSILLFYTVVLLFLWLPLEDFAKDRKKWWIGLVISVAAGLLFFQPRFGMEITMLDVGQGDALVIRSSSGRIYLSDCGSSSVKQVGKYRLLPFLKSKGYGKIEGIFISHLDEDHYNGITYLLEEGGKEGIRIGTLYLPVSVQNKGEREKQKLEEIVELGEEVGVDIVYLQAGDWIQDKETIFSCLYPDKTSKEAEGNNGSMVLEAEYKTFSLLLTGDVEEKGEKEILDKEEARFEKKEGCRVLKVAHHGSFSSSTEEFLGAISPSVGLISCGKENPYGHPHQETLKRLEASGCRVLTTAEYGAITVEVRRGVKIYGYHSP